MKKETTGEQLSRINTEIVHIKDDIHDIKSNHLHTIQENFEALRKQFAEFELKILNRLPAWGTIIITILSSLSVGLVVYGCMRK